MPITADRNLKVDIVTRREVFMARRPWSTGCNAHRPARAGTSARRQRWPRRICCLYLRGAQAPTLRPSATTALRRSEPQTCHFRGGKLWVSRREGTQVNSSSFFVDHLATSVVGGRERRFLARKRICKERLLQIYGTGKITHVAILRRA